MFSYSQINRWKECGRKYTLSRQFKSLTEGSALPFGKAIDEATGYMLEHRDDPTALAESLALFVNFWENGTPDSYNPEPKEVYGSLEYAYYKSDYDHRCVDALESSVTELEELRKELMPESKDIDDAHKTCLGLMDSEKFTEDHQQFYNYTSWYSLLYKGKLMLTAFFEQIIPLVEEVYSVQEEIILDSEDGNAKRGFLDCVLKLKGWDKPIVIDIKTAGRAYVQHQLKTSDQLIGYLAAVEEDYDTDLVGYIVLLKQPTASYTCDKCGAKKPKGSRKRNCEECDGGKYNKVLLAGATQLMVTSIDTSIIDESIESDLEVMKAINHEIFPKNPSACMNYNRKCDYYDICWSGKDGDDIAHLESKK